MNERDPKRECPPPEHLQPVEVKGDVAGPRRPDSECDGCGADTTKTDGWCPKCEPDKPRSVPAVPRELPHGPLCPPEEKPSESGVFQLRYEQLIRNMYAALPGYDLRGGISDMEGPARAAARWFGDLKLATAPADRPCRALLIPDGLGHDVVVYDPPDYPGVLVVSTGKDGLRLWWDGDGKRKDFLSRDQLTPQAPPENISEEVREHRNMIARWQQEVYERANTIGSVTAHVLPEMTGGATIAVGHIGGGGGERIVLMVDDRPLLLSHDAAWHLRHLLDDALESKEPRAGAE